MSVYEIKRFAISIILGLVQDDRGKFSHSKFWSNVAYAITSWVIIKLTMDGKISVDYFLWYLIIAGGHSAIAKYINARQSGSYQFSNEVEHRYGAKKPEERIE